MKHRLRCLPAALALRVVQAASAQYVVVALFALGMVVPPASAAAAPVYAVTTCANPHLPSDILAGDGPGGDAPPLPVVDATVNKLTLRLAVASEESSRELGLMCVTRLRAHAGMIFVFQRTANQEFWMKNTLIPLDMIWVAADGTVTSVAAEVPASTMQTSDDQVARRTGNGRFVIELPSQEAAADGIAVGTRLILPPLTASQ